MGREELRTPVVFVVRWRFSMQGLHKKAAHPFLKEYSTIIVLHRFQSRAEREPGYTKHWRAFKFLTPHAVD